MENNTVEVVETKEKKKREPMTTKQKVFLGLRIAFNVVFYALIIFLFLFSIMNIRGGNGTTNFPNIFGKGFLSVQSDSMNRDAVKNPTVSHPEWDDYKIGGFASGDLLNANTFDKGQANNLKMGDVIVFRWTINNESKLNTHRIVYVHRDETTNNVDYVLTQGDYAALSNMTAYNINEPLDSTNNTMKIMNGNVENVSVDKIVGVITGVNSGAGKVLDTIQKNWLFIFVIPIIVLLVIEVFLVIRNIMILRGEKNKLELADSKEAMLAEVEAEKEKMRQELLAELRAQGLAPQEEPKPEAEEVKEETQEDAPAEEAVLVSEEKTTEEVAEDKTEETETEENIEVTEEKKETAEETSEEVVEEVKEDKVEESTDDNSEE